MIPDFQTLMLPVLTAGANGEISTRDVILKLADDFELTKDEREYVLPSGKIRRFDNRVSWAKSYLKQAGLVKYTKRGFYAATDEGLKILTQNLDRIDNKFLLQFDSFQEFRARKSSRSNGTDDDHSFDDDTDQTPDEVLRAAHSQINASLAADLLDRVRTSSPEFFEGLIIELLLAMGYGGPSEEAGRRLGQSGDNGVDGVIDQDPLGVDQIYVQAKRYAEGTNISASDIRDFYGALSLKRAQKGIFFTTSKFSPSAAETAQGLGIRIVLINGMQLSKLMIQYNIGCRIEETLYLKNLDDEFFEGE